MDWQKCTTQTLEDLEHEFHSIRRLMERRRQVGKELPDLISNFANLIEPLGEAFQ